jgi:hypothetical protein
VACNANALNTAVQSRANVRGDEDIALEKPNRRERSAIADREAPHEEPDSNPD